MHVGIHGNQHDVNAMHKLLFNAKDFRKFCFILESLSGGVSRVRSSASTGVWDIDLQAKSVVHLFLPHSFAPLHFVFVLLPSDSPLID